jgi:hypothetical protein
MKKNRTPLEWSIMAGVVSVVFVCALSFYSNGHFVWAFSFNWVQALAFWILNLIMAILASYIAGYFNSLTAFKALLFQHRLNYDEINLQGIKGFLKEKAHFFLIRLTINADEDGLDEDETLIYGVEEWDWHIGFIHEVAEDNDIQRFDGLLKKFLNMHTDGKPQLRKKLSTTQLGFRKHSDFILLRQSLERKFRAKGIDYVPHLATTSSILMTGTIRSNDPHDFPRFDQLDLSKLEVNKLVLNTYQHISNPSFKGVSADELGKMILAEVIQLLPIQATNYKDIYVKNAPQDWGDPKDSENILKLFKGDL